MRRILRENALCALMAAVGCATVAWLSLYGFAWNDYESEAQPAFSALAHGHLLTFLRLAPAYGGSLILRAPFALIPKLWGGGELAVYRSTAFPGLLAVGAMGIYLVAYMRANGRPLLWRAVALGVCVANPISVRALELGHPEELLGATLCLACVMLAAADRPLLAGLLLGAAIANKEWAVLALGPALLALPSRRVLLLLSATATAGALTAPMVLVGSGSFVSSVRGAASPSSAIFQPMQVFWFLGHHSPLAGKLLGVEKRDFRLAPAWVGRVSHPLVVAIAVPITLATWHTRRNGRSQHSQKPAGGAIASRKDALLLLALLLLLRCMLDTWDNVYYPLPFILALLAWEIELPRPPVLALSSCVAVWANAQLSLHTSADAQAVFFLVWSLPLAAWLGARLFLRGQPALGGRLGHRLDARTRETAMNALEASP